MHKDETSDDAALIELSGSIVAAYVGHNALAAADLPKLIAEVYSALRGLGTSEPIPQEDVQPQKPAVSIRRSVTPEHIVCLEDGKMFRSMKRHLARHHGMTPDEYREKWGLPADYPMVAPNYSKARSHLAKTTGLGRKPGEPARNGRKSPA